MRLSQFLPPFLRPQPGLQSAASSPSVVPVGDRLTLTSRPKLSGSFLQLSSAHLSEPPEAMEARLAAMKAVGMDMVIIQFSAHNGEDLSPAVDRVLDAAARQGMKVWLGTPLEERSWWQKSWSPFFLRSIIPQVEQETFAAVSRVANHPALAGVYLPYETNGLSDPVAMGEFLGAMSRAAKRAKPGVPVMISPYTNIVPGRVGSLPPMALTAWWDAVLSRANVDVMAWQDGVGASTAQLGQVDQDLGALSKAAKKNGVQLWANVEAFERTSALNQPFQATAAPFDRFERQLQAVSPWVDRVVSFDFNDYMDPSQGEDQRRLYEAYRAYAERLP